METSNENDTYNLSWKNYINWTNIAILSAIILILFLSLFLATRPNFISAFDFSDTGNIGDTIGGITAPIINIIGAYLVYISFMAQIKANKIQFDMLKDERQNRELERNFEITLNLFLNLKEDFSKLRYNQYTSSGAINSFINELKNRPKEELNNITAKNLFNDFYFLINHYYLILHRIDKIKMNPGEKRQLFMILNIFYSTNLKYPCNKLTETFSKYDIHKSYSSFFSAIEEDHKRILNNLK
jgi:hypothetical protein